MYLLGTLNPEKIAYVEGRISYAITQPVILFSDPVHYFTNPLLLTIYSKIGTYVCTSQ